MINNLKLPRCKFNVCSWWRWCTITKVWKVYVIHHCLWFHFLEILKFGKRYRGFLLQENLNKKQFKLTVELSGGVPPSMASAFRSYVATDSLSNALLVLTTPEAGSTTKEPSSRSRGSSSKCTRPLRPTSASDALTCVTEVPVRDSVLTLLAITFK